MTNNRFAIVVGLGLVLVGIGLSAFVVNERELAIKLQLGQVVEANYEPGGALSILYVFTRRPAACCRLATTVFPRLSRTPW